MDQRDFRGVLGELASEGRIPALAPYYERNPQPAPEPKKAAPRGPQKYLGNGKHEWEPVANGTDRLRVPGGWLYAKVGGDMVFVPVPDVVGYAI